MHVRCSFVVPYFVEGLPEGGNQAGRCDAENTRAQQKDVKKKRRSDACRMDVVDMVQAAVRVGDLTRVTIQITGTNRILMLFITSIM